MSTRDKDEWLFGYAAALGAVQRLYGENVVVAQVMASDGITVDDLRAAGVEEYDLGPILKAIAYRGAQ